MAEETKIDLDELERLEKAASAGPWHTVRDNHIELNEVFSDRLVQGHEIDGGKRAAELSSSWKVL